jgi:signal transduction histidine kinase
MDLILATGYLRSGFQSDRRTWADRGLNAEQLYSAIQATLSRNVALASEHFTTIFEPEDPDERLLYWCAHASLHDLSGDSLLEDSAMEQARQIESQATAYTRACFFLRQTVYLRTRHRNDESLQSAFRAEALLPDASCTIVRGFVAYEIGLSLLRLGNVPAAAYRLRYAYRELKSQLDPIQLATLSINLGAVYVRSDEYERTINVLSPLLRFQPLSIGLWNYTSATLWVGVAQHMLKNYSEAIRCYRRILREFTSSIERERYLQAAAGLVDALCEVGELDEAAEVLHFHLQTSNELSASDTYLLHASLGKLHAKRLNFAASRHHYYLALEVVRSDELANRHRVLLENFIASGCIESPEELVSAYRELVEVSGLVLRQQSVTDNQREVLLGDEIPVDLQHVQERWSEDLQLVADAQDRVSNAIGSHLHSTTLQELTLLRLRLEELQSRTHDVDMLRDVHWLIEQTMSITEQVRDVSHVLHQHFVHGNNLAHAFTDYAVYTQRHAGGIGVAFSEQGVSCAVSDNLARSIYRCAQICVQNAIHHAQCSLITIQLVWSRGHLELICSDNGNGFDPDATKDGIGLRELRARVRHASGTIMITSSEAAGTQMVASFPITTAMKNFI